MLNGTIDLWDKASLSRVFMSIFLAMDSKKKSGIEDEWSRGYNEGKNDMFKALAVAFGLGSPSDIDRYTSSLE